jgi:hypothetical protein
MLRGGSCVCLVIGELVAVLSHQPTFDSVMDPVLNHEQLPYGVVQIQRA